MGLKSSFSFFVSEGDLCKQGNQYMRMSFWYSAAIETVEIKSCRAVSSSLLLLKVLLSHKTSL